MMLCYLLRNNLVGNNVCIQLTFVTSQFFLSAHKWIWDPSQSTADGFKIAMFTSIADRITRSSL